LVTAIDSLFAKASKPQELEVLVYLDEDDPKLGHYKEVLKSRYLEENFHGRVEFFVGKRIPVPKALNVLAKYSTGDTLFVYSDDTLIETQGWDDLISEEFSKSDDFLVVYPNAGRSREKLEYWFCKRKLVKTLGFMAPEHFEHFCADEWIEKVARANDRLVFARHVVVKHMHPKYGLAEWDDTYLAKRGENNTSPKDNARMGSLLLELTKDQEKVREAIASSLPKHP
jgi:hypothetical protein